MFWSNLRLVRNWYKRPLLLLRVIGCNSVVILLIIRCKIVWTVALVTCRRMSASKRLVASVACARRWWMAMKPCADRRSSPLLSMLKKWRREPLRGYEKLTRLDLARRCLRCRMLLCRLSGPVRSNFALVNTYGLRCRVLIIVWLGPLTMVNGSRLLLGLVVMSCRTYGKVRRLTMPFGKFRST